MTANDGMADQDTLVARSRLAGTSSVRTVVGIITTEDQDAFDRAERRERLVCNE